jgi:hypothetical protein
LIDHSVGGRATNISTAAVGEASSESHQPQSAGNQEDGIFEAKENNHIPIPSHQPQEAAESHEPQSVGNQGDGIFEARENNHIYFLNHQPQELSIYTIPTNDFIPLPNHQPQEFNIDTIPTHDFSFNDNDDAFLALLSGYQEI